MAENDSKTTEGTEGVVIPGEQESGAETQPEGKEAESFSAEYVKELRDEAAASRVQAKRATALEVALRTAVIGSVARSILVDTDDLQWSDDLADDDGMPDAQKIREAATALAEAKPHLGRVSGNTGQGFRGEESDAFSILSVLNSAAR